MNKETIYKDITEKIIAGLEKAGSWQSMITGNAGFPVSIKGHMYTGINFLTLLCELDEQAFSSQVWSTYKAAADLSGQVRKGEKGTRIIFYKLAEVANSKTGEIEEIPFMRYSSVFNADQIDWNKGEPEIVARDKAGRNENDTIQSAEQIVEAWEDKPQILHSIAKGNAGYSPSSDAVMMPPKSMYDDSAHYYHELFHELVHSTGHKDRLDRGMSTDHKSYEYSKEELVAEIGAAYLSKLAGLDAGIERSQSYIRSWKSVLSENEDWIAYAASRAQKAVNLITESSKVLETV